MNCEGFLAAYSDFRDGLIGPGETAALEDHLESCPACARYDRVMRRGLELLESLPSAESSADFMPRLRHRLYNVDDGVIASSRRRGGSAALAGVAAVGLLALFWLPFAASVPVELELPPVAVDTPPEPGPALPSLFDEGPFLTSLVRTPSAPRLDEELAKWPPPYRMRAGALVLVSTRQTATTFPAR
ncbi:MAG: anti-sigma factor family protein [Gemmatimonadota bacterium]